MNIRQVLNPAQTEITRETSSSSSKKGVMFFLPASTVPTRRRVQFLSCQPQTAGQLHLVVIKETFARVLASRRKRPQCRGINICQRAHLGSALRRLTVLFHVTPV
ncbi:hypothetical protein AVEN_187512-1 [Araneus ventricosus]|uniref:Uncharacterized protein n=1 Tax=Araneus ventricosus TaxID=182803 RepID=A0A4Y2BV67_ARAVE|nr:hypothetical protein AVEN_187512-1 [Araneus ventricosus]